MKLQPTSNYVLLEDTKEGQKTDGGILLPDGAEQQPYAKAVILAIGPEVNSLANGGRGPDIITVGDTAVFAVDSAVTIEIDKNKYLVVGSRSVCAVIK